MPSSHPEDHRWLARQRSRATLRLVAWLLLMSASFALLGLFLFSALFPGVAERWGPGSHLAAWLVGSALFVVVALAVIRRRVRRLSRRAGRDTSRDRDATGRVTC